MGETADKQGFTYTELAILTLAVSALIFLFGAVLSRSQETGRTRICQNNVRQILQAVENYEADWLAPPQQLADLYPAHLPKIQSFFCPDDRSRPGLEDQAVALRKTEPDYDDTSYSQTYFFRFLNAEDDNKMLLCCTRHQKNTRTVAGYLSFAVETSPSQPVLWKPAGGNTVVAEFGENYSGADGRLTFADGTVIKIIGGTVKLHSSFLDGDEKTRGTVCLDDPDEGIPANEIEVIHPAPQPFEIVTPLFIAEPTAGASCRVRVQSPDAGGLAENSVTRLDQSEPSAKVRVRNRASRKRTVLANGSPAHRENTFWDGDDWHQWRRGKNHKHPPRPHPRHNR